MADFWLRAVGNENHVTTAKAVNERKILTESLQNAVRQLMIAAFEVDVHGKPQLITEENNDFSFFCNALENILKHGLRTKVERFRIYGNVYYYQYLDTLDKVEPSCANFSNTVRNLANVKSFEGKGRSWIRAALNLNLLDQYLGILVNNIEHTKIWYTDHAFLCNHEEVSFLLSLLVGLNGVPFTLLVDDPNLEEAAPISTFPTMATKIDITAPLVTPKKKKKAKKKVVDIDSVTDTSSGTKNYSNGLSAPASRVAPLQSSSPKLESRSEEDILAEILNKRTSFLDEPVPSNLADPVVVNNSASISEPPLIDISIPAPETSPEPAPLVDLMSLANEHTPSLIPPTVELKEEVQLESKEETSIAITESLEVETKEECLEDTTTTTISEEVESTSVEVKDAPAPDSIDISNSLVPVEPAIFQQVEDQKQYEPEPIPESQPEPLPAIEIATKLAIVEPAKPISNDSINVAQVSMQEMPPLDSVVEEPPPKEEPPKEEPPKEEPAPNEAGDKTLEFQQVNQEEDEEEEIKKLLEETRKLEEERKRIEIMKKEREERLSKLRMGTSVEDLIQAALATQPIKIELTYPKPTTIVEISATSIEPEKLINEDKVVPSATEEPPKELKEAEITTQEQPTIETNSLSSSPAMGDKSKLDSSSEHDRVSTPADNEDDDDAISLDTHSTPTEDDKEDPSSNLSSKTTSFSDSTEEEPVDMSSRSFSSFEFILQQQQQRKEQQQELSTSIDEPSSLSMTNKYYRKYLRQSLPDEDASSPFSTSLPSTSYIPSTTNYRGSLTDLPSMTTQRETVSEKRTHQPIAATPRSATMSSLPPTTKKSQTISSPVRSFSGPRKRIYFDIHVKGTPKDQRNLCHMCSSPLPSSLFDKPRYCDYTGKYFCKNCHQNDTSVIPARILHRWDFKPRPVSKFAKDFIDTMFDEPVFDISAINADLYRVVPDLKTLKIMRQQLIYMREFIMTCRDRDLLLGFVGDRNHLMNDTDFYSLRDLTEMSKGNLQKSLFELAKKYLEHIKSCTLCKAKGSICEFCRSPKPIYPFNLKQTIQCKLCGGLAHQKCYVKEKCPKCLRKAQQKA